MIQTRPLIVLSRFIQVDLNEDHRNRRLLRKKLKKKKKQRDRDLFPPHITRHYPTTPFLLRDVTQQSRATFLHSSPPRLVFFIFQFPLLLYPTRGI